MIFSVGAGLVAAVLAVMGWFGRRTTFGAGAFVVACLSAASWCWSIAAFDRLDEAGHYPYPIVALWLASVSLCVAAVFVMARRAVRPQWSPDGWLVALFVLEPLSIFVLELTNPLHGLVGSKPDGELVFGVAYQVHAAYCVALVLASAISLATRASRADRAQRGQIIVLQTLVVSVVVVEMSQLGVTQYIAVAGLLVLHRSMFGHGLNELVPMDLGAAVEHMGDQAFFFDGRGRLVGLNASARLATADRPSGVPRIGTAVDEVFGTTVTLAEGSDTVVVFGEGTSAVQLVAQCTPMTDPAGTSPGWVLICRDVPMVMAQPSRRSGDRPVQHDPVTGVLTRAQLDHELRRAVDRAADDARPLSIALLDVDGFKSINDAHGHLAGDDVLREIAQRVEAEAQGKGVLGRFGGDEFVVVLSGHGVAEAARLAELMCASVASSPMKAGDVMAEVTITIGVAQHRGGSVADLVRSADMAMYEGKRAGRNRVRTSIA